MTLYLLQQCLCSPANRDQRSYWCGNGYQEEANRTPLVDNSMEAIHVGNWHGEEGEAWENHDLVEAHGRDKDNWEEEHKLVEEGEESP